MGNIVFKNDLWHIDGHDQIKEGETIEVLVNGVWKEIRVGKDANGIFHPQPHGEPFEAAMIVRRPK